MPFGVGSESIGTAYVRIVANGDGLPESVRDEMERAEPEVRRAGESAGEEYMGGFNDEVERNGPGTQRSIDDAISRGAGRADERLRILGSEKWDQIAAGLEDRIGSSDIASRITTSLREDFERGASFETILDSLDHDLIPRIQEAERTITREVEEQARRRASATDEEVNERGNALTRFGGFLRRFSDRNNELGDSVGRAFGRGSRNNFLNFFGGMIGGVVKLLGLIPRLGASLIEMSQNASTAFRTTLDETGSFSKAITAVFSSAVESGGTSLAALAAGVLLLVTILPIFISVITLAAGAVTALAASISFALVGGLAAVAGLLPVVGVGLGVLAAGILSMDDKTKALLKDRIQPLIDEFKSLGKVASGELFKDAGAQTDELVAGLSKLEPLVRRSASALSDVGDDVTRGLNGRVFDSFIKTLEFFAPRALRSLGHTATDTLGGIAGLLIEIMQTGGPADRLLSWIGDAADEFNDWANSKEGREEIADFLDRAADSAASLGELLDNVGEALGTLLTAGQGTGDTIIDQLAAKVQDFTDYLNENPDAVANFFGDAGDFAAGVGSAVNEIIHLIDILDSPNSRKAATALVAGVSASVQFLGILFTSVDSGIHRTEVIFGNSVEGILRVVATLLDGIGSLGNVLGKLPGVPDGLGQSAKDAADKIRGLADDVGGLGNSVKKLPGKTNVTIDDKGTFGKTRSLADAIKRAIDSIPKNTILHINTVETNSSGKRVSGRTTSATGSIINGYGNITKRGMAAGGLLNSQIDYRGIVAAEAGREAIVPLDRPLGEVDPSVRYLSAIAQGLTPIVSGGKGDMHVTIVTPTKDPYAVAREVYNELTAGGME